MPDILSETEKHEFAMTEYKEAAAAFFKGVDIGVTYIKIFILLNGVLLAGLGFKSALIDAVPVQGNGNPLAVLKDMDLSGKAPWVGLLFSALLFGIVPYYDRQLANCSRRCADIEKKYGGDLFARIHSETEDKKRWATGVRGIQAIALITAAFWLYVLPIKSWFIWLRDLSGF